MTAVKALVETVQLDSSGGRQISSRTGTTSLLQDRRADIEAAVSEATAIMRTLLPKSRTRRMAGQEHRSEIRTYLGRGGGRHLVEDVSGSVYRGHGYD